MGVFKCFECGKNTVNNLCVFKCSWKRLYCLKSVVLGAWLTCIWQRFVVSTWDGAHVDFIPVWNKFFQLFQHHTNAQFIFCGGRCVHFLYFGNLFGWDEVLVGVSARPQFSEITEQVTSTVPVTLQALFADRKCPVMSGCRAISVGGKYKTTGLCRID